MVTPSVCLTTVLFGTVYAEFKILSTQPYQPVRNDVGAHRLQHCGRSLSGNPHESAVPCVRRRRFVCLSPWTIRCRFLATSSATNGRVAPSPHGSDRSFQRPEGIAPFRSFLTLRERP